MVIDATVFVQVYFAFLDIPLDILIVATEVIKLFFKFTFITG